MDDLETGALIARNSTKSVDNVENAGIKRVQAVDNCNRRVVPGVTPLLQSAPLIFEALDQLTCAKPQVSAPKALEGG